MKALLHKIEDKLEIAKEDISEIEVRLTEIIQNETQKEKKIKNSFTEWGSIFLKSESLNQDGW